MKALVVMVIAFTLTGCETQDAMDRVRPSDTLSDYRPVTDNVYSFVDKAMNVRCWVYQSGYQGGISCIPVDQLTPVSP